MLIIFGVDNQGYQHVLISLASKPIANAVFRVDYEQPGGGVATVGTFRTGADGKIVLPQVGVGWYIITEIQAAPGYSLPKNPVTRLYLSPGQNAYTAAELTGGYSAGGTSNTGGTAATSRAGGAATMAAEFGDSDSDGGAGGGIITAKSGAEFIMGVDTEGGLIYNFPLNSVVIKKTDAITGELLAGAAFELYRADEQVSGVPGTAIGRYTTDNSGIIVIVGLEAGYYVVKEAQAPTSYLISENSRQNGFLKADGTTILEFSFANYPYGSLLIAKVDAQTNKPLLGARFKVTDGAGAVVGASNGEFTTDTNGEILLSHLKPGAYVVTELAAPSGYERDTTPQTIQIGTDGKTYKVTFADQPLGALIIKKYNAATKEPLAGASFMVTDIAGAAVGTGGGVYKTDVHIIGVNWANSRKYSNQKSRHRLM